MQEHEADCVLPNSPFLLKDVFDLDETSEIPRVAQDACLHIIKTKMKKDDSTSCKFKSGDPKPTVVSFIPTAYKASDIVTKKFFAETNNSSEK